MVSAEKYCTGTWDVWTLGGNPREVFSLRRTCQLKMFGLNGGWDFKFSSASVWTHKTLLELELFVHSWGPAWTHTAHYKTSLVWAVCPLLEKYCCPLWEQCFCLLFELLVHCWSNVVVLYGSPVFGLHPLLSWGDLPGMGSSARSVYTQGDRLQQQCLWKWKTLSALFPVNESRWVPRRTDERGNMSPKWYRHAHSRCFALPCLQNFI